MHSGLLILRVGVGIVFMMHGIPKLLGGPELWAKYGQAMSHIGIDFFPAFWGFMAAFAEAVGGLLILLGLAFLPATLILSFTMLIAFWMHFSTDADFVKYSHPLKSLIVFISLAVTGPGKYRLSKFIVK